MLEPGGLFVGTCATWQRVPHSAYGFPELPPNEYYANVGAGDLANILQAVGFKSYTVDVARDGNDLRWSARK
jgi:hypothetical protein